MIATIEGEIGPVHLCSKLTLLTDITHAILDGLAGGDGLRWQWLSLQPSFSSSWSRMISASCLINTDAFPGAFRKDVDARPVDSHSTEQVWFIHFLQRTIWHETGWTTKLPGGAAPPYSQNATQQQQWPQQNTYNNNQDYNQNQAPQNGYYGQNQSYFGGQRDTEMQAPQNVYSNNTGSTYAPPAGPPPGKVH